MGMIESSEPREYELDDEEDDEVRGVARHAIVWGAVCLFAGAGCVAAMLSERLMLLPGDDPWLLGPASLVELSLGATFLLAGLRFRAAVTTKGRDIANVMTALTHLSRALLVQIIVAAVAMSVVAAIAVVKLWGR